MNTEMKKAIICAGIYGNSVDNGKVFNYIPQAGDVAVFEVLSVGKHKAIQTEGGRNTSIFPGDRIMAAFGNRYASNQFEGVVPTEYLERFHILGQGGVIGIVKSAHAGMPKPTVVKIIGYAVDSRGEVLNTKSGRQEEMEPFSGAVPARAKVVLSVGASMDSGKTTTAGHLTRSLKKIGKRVAYIKLTGTVYTKDMDFCRDCGADFVIDFSAMGFPSTYLCDKEEILDLYQTLLDRASKIQPDYILVEIADGLYQRETNFLLKSRRFLSTVYGVLFSCADSLSAANGVQYLTALGFPPLAVCGTYTMSPMLIEEVQSLCDVKTATLTEILAPEFAYEIEAAGYRVND
jgi:hypothetical protein